MYAGSEVRELFIDNPLVRIYFIIVMIRWTGLVPFEFEFPFPGSLTSTVLRFISLSPKRQTLIAEKLSNEYVGLTQFMSTLPQPGQALPSAILGPCV